jgi:hypothetical protein
MASPADGQIRFRTNDNTVLLDFGTVDSGSIDSVNSHLILSSSAGSHVHISGALIVGTGSDGLCALRFGGDETSGADPMILKNGDDLEVKRADDGAWKNMSAGYFIAATVGFRTPSAGHVDWQGKSRFASPEDGQINLTNADDEVMLELGSAASGTITAPSSSLILSSSAGSNVYVSGTFHSMGNMKSFAGLEVDGSFWMDGANFIMRHSRPAFYSSAGSLILSSSHNSIVSVSGNLEVHGQTFSPVFTGHPSGSTPLYTVDWNSGSSQTIEAASSSLALTASMANPQSGASYIVKVIQHPVTAIDVLFSASDGSLIYHEDGSLYDATATTDGIDIVSVYYDGSDYFISYGSNFATV